jgi:NAD-dependent deacetylase
LDEQLIYSWKKDLNIGDTCEKGAQLRPHIVWFGEQVPMIETAANIVSKADILIVIGTSLVVYPAAGLVHYTDYTVPKYVIDPNKPAITQLQNVEYITEKASIGMQQLYQQLMEA